MKISTRGGDAFSLIIVDLRDSVFETIGMQMPFCCRYVEM